MNKEIWYSRRIHTVRTHFVGDEPRTRRRVDHHGIGQSSYVPDKEDQPDDNTKVRAFIHTPHVMNTWLDGLADPISVPIVEVRVFHPEIPASKLLTIDNWVMTSGGGGRGMRESRVANRESHK